MKKFLCVWGSWEPKCQHHYDNTGFYVNADWFTKEENGYEADEIGIINHLDVGQTYLGENYMVYRKE